MKPDLTLIVGTLFFLAGVGLPTAPRLARFVLIAMLLLIGGTMMIIGLWSERITPLPGILGTLAE